jgi:hypothetical protein
MNDGFRFFLQLVTKSIVLLFVGKSEQRNEVPVVKQFEFFCVMDVVYHFTSVSGVQT